MTSKAILKILLVSQEYPPETARGGIGSQTYAKAKGLSGMGHKVFVISRSIDEQRHENLLENITVIRIPGFENDLPDMTEIVQWVTHSIAVAFETEALHKRIGIDIIDFPEWAAEGFTYLLNRTGWNTIPTVIQLHGPLVMFGHTMGWPEMNSTFFRVGTQMEATCVQLADAVYSSSQCSTRWINQYYDAEKRDIPTIHLGIDINVFKPGRVPKNNRLTILFIGKIVQNKGVEELVDAAVNLAKDFPALQVRLIGSGREKYIEQLQDKAKLSGVPDLLDFAGFIDKEYLPLELSKAHVFCAPSYYEGGPGFVYLEAMACGLPVVGCSGSGVEEIISSGFNGLLVPPMDHNALENALRLVLKNKELLNEMSLNAREYVIREADRNICLQKLEAFYYSVLESITRKTKAL